MDIERRRREGGGRRKAWRHGAKDEGGEGGEHEGEGGGQSPRVGCGEEAENTRPSWDSLTASEDSSELGSNAGDMLSTRPPLLPGMPSSLATWTCELDGDWELCGRGTGVPERRAGRAAIAPPPHRPQSRPGRAATAA